ncbi:MAG: glycosyltransferase [Gammaproteobacteria bacterium]|nr:glycosyltransferase [Gammaproteobacteria bacterium]
MTKSPTVSVVMSVFDKPDHVARSINSVLNQSEINLELIVVSDGACDSVVETINGFDDSRLTRINQVNQGLTNALINGCKAAKSPYIARIDAGDEMAPQRLVLQSEFLSSNPTVAVVGCAVKMVTEEGFPLFDVNMSADDLQRRLISTRVGDFKSYVHSSVMFRKQAYEQVGGYRSEFYFTQDCDLWARFVWAGFNLGMINETMQTNVFSSSGISGQHRASQQALEKIIVEMNRLRSLGQNDSPLLTEAARFRPSSRDAITIARRADNFEGDYFIASTLSLSSPKQALVYWRKTFSAKPWSLKVLVKASACWLRALVA